ncbi:MAG: PDZ domain-containing protein, partial [Gammaproteobacteria bacterium]
ERAGLRSGDVIIRLDGQTVSSSSDLRNAIGLLRVGTRIELGVLRNGSLRILRAVITDPLASSTAAGTISKHLSGAVLGAISDNHPFAGQVKGVEVLEIERDSPAWSAGLRAADIIMSVNQLPVSSMDELAQALGRSVDMLLLKIRRGNGALFMVIH